FRGADGCNEILNLSRPDVVSHVHAAYLDAGADAIETNSFGANPSNLGEYGLSGTMPELALAAARIAREVAGSYTTPRWVFGSMGPGSKLPSLGHVSYAELRDAYQAQAAALLEGGADLLLIETAQDLLQAKAAVVGARRARAQAGRDAPIVVQITVETTGKMLLGTDTAAALTALTALGVDGMGLNCATGPELMREQLRQLASVPLLTAMPNAGLPQLGPDGAVYPLGPEELADALEEFAGGLGVGVVGGCCGTTPAHIAAVAARLAGRDVAPRPQARPRPSAGSVSSLYTQVQLSQDTSYLAIGERANAQGSKAFRKAMTAGDLDTMVQIARDQARQGAHVMDLSVDAVGRDGVADMAAIAARLATASTLPIMVDSTEPEVIEAALERLGGRSIVNSVSFEDGGQRLELLAPVIREHGAAVVALTIDEAGQARTAQRKAAIAGRLIAALGGRGIDPADIIVDPLTFPIATGAEESRRDGLETLRAVALIRAAHPDVHIALGVSNVSFGLAPAARTVLNSVFLARAVAAGLDAAIVNPARILPLDRLDPAAVRAADDLLEDSRGTGALAALLALGPESAGAAEPLDGLPAGQRLARRVVLGERAGLEEDIAEALRSQSALDIVNGLLLPAMAEVGEAFGAGRMQLPFVLQSAEVMKAAVALLEGHLGGRGAGAKGTLVLATVRGDVHDIGKNLVDIILTNNGYRVVNLGIKQPVDAMLEAAEREGADAIGMSGLLVKSTVVMRENLQEMNARGALWPVILGGAALTRAHVESDLAAEYQGEVRYARDAFEALRIMDALASARPGQAPTAPPPPPEPPPDSPSDSPPSFRALAGDSGTRMVDAPQPPFWGSRVVRGIPLADIAARLDERSLFAGRWGLKSAPGGGPAYRELVESEGRPRLRALLERIQAEGIAVPGVAYGWFPARAEGNSVVIEYGGRTHRWVFPRRRRAPRLCLADYFRPDRDVVGLQTVTMGPHFAEAAGELHAAGRYREYFELHGLGVQLAEALADYWHNRMREELGIDGGLRYSFGYPACPDLAGRRALAALVGSARIGVQLTETDLLTPEQSTDALVVHHPDAIRFGMKGA
ncbi:MAG: homocysteine S-methyltransferase family protein, partial [Bifidobacteriaceae bacterium]|nr:homocysteine S-methyltransferase family protein [Bifidobacteriaceae bacterium]